MKKVITIKIRILLICLVSGAVQRRIKVFESEMKKLLNDVFCETEQLDEIYMVVSLDA